jgi:hypothetical protein
MFSIKVPVHRGRNSGIERMGRVPPEFVANLLRVDPVPLIVAGAIGDWRDQIPVEARAARPKLVEQGAQPL